MAHDNLANAKKAKNDEFYTRYDDIQKEIEAYLEYDSNTFLNKVVYCNCDDPYESNFFRFFILNFKRLGLKQLITTSYKSSSIANTQLDLFGNNITSSKNQKGRPKETASKFIINDVYDINGDGEFNLKDIHQQLRENKNNEWKPLKGDGDFRSEECVELLKQSDIVVTNPPFSLFREYVTQLVKYDKKFIIVGNTNSVTYKQIFPLIKNNKIWLGCTNFNKGMFFEIPNYYNKFHHIDLDTGKKIARVSTSCWYTNLDHGRRHQPLNLMTMADNLRFSRHKKVIENGYKKYDNYDAIEVPFVDAIPSDYEGVMGVPITFLDKYCSEQFEIIGISSNGIVDKKYKLPHFKKHNEPYVDNKKIYQRIFIKKVTK